MDENLNIKQSNITVKGIVKDENGEPLGGVSVVVKGTTIETITGQDGTYTINVPGSGSTLIFAQNLKVSDRK